MNDNFSLNILNKIKKILSELTAQKEQIDNVDTNVSKLASTIDNVNSNVTNINTVSEEIKSLIGEEISAQLNTLQSNIVAAMPSSSGGLSSCIKSVQFKTGTPAATSSSVTTTTISFTSVDINKTLFLVSGVGHKITSRAATKIVLSSENTSYASGSGMSGTYYFDSYSVQIIEFY